MLLQQPRCTLAVRPRPRHIPSRAAPARARSKVALQAAATASTSAPAAGRAVVIGSGIAGLAASQVLSEHFPEVLVLEHDAPTPSWQKGALAMCQDKGARRGVQQYNMLHAMAAGGLKALDDLWAGAYSAGLAEAGAVISDGMSSIAFVHPTFGAWPRGAAGSAPVNIACCSRHVFESTARRLLESRAPCVAFRYGARVTGLTLADELATGSRSDSRAVTGVSLSDGSLLPAALVVDCSGRLSRMPEWLSAAGYPAPRVSHAAAGVGYASWFLQLRPDAVAALEGVSALFVMSEPPERSLAFLFRVEGPANSWMVSVGGYKGLHPPFHDKQLVDWATQEVWHPVIGQLLAGSTQLGPASRFYGVGSSWRHYEELVLPERLLVMGDAVCSFNPVYGQGMCVAALQAQKLQGLLARRSTASSTASDVPQLDLSRLSAEFQATVQPLVAQAWEAAAGSDAKHGLTAGSEASNNGLLARAVSGFIQGYLSAAFEVAAGDVAVKEALSRVMQMLGPPGNLMEPAVASKVLLRQLRTLLVRTFNALAGSSSSSSTAGGGAGAAESIISAARARVLSGDNRFDLGLRLPGTRATAAGSGVTSSHGQKVDRDERARGTAAGGDVRHAVQSRRAD